MINSVVSLTVGGLSGLTCVATNTRHPGVHAARNLRLLRMMLSPKPHSIPDVRLTSLASPSVGNARGLSLPPTLQRRGRG